MFTSFTEFFFFRRKRRRKIVKISIISASILLLLFVSLKITSFIIFGKSIEKFLEESKKNPSYTAFEYKISKSFLKQKVIIKDVKISVQAGDVIVDNLELKPKKGIVIPQEIFVKFNTIKSVDSKKTYDFRVKEGQDYISIKLNKKFFKKPTFGGIKIEKPMVIGVFDKDNEVGVIKSEFLDVIDKMDAKNIGEKNVKAKVSFLFHNVSFLNYLIPADRPVSLDIDVEQKGFYKRWGINNENKTNMVSFKFNKFNILYDYANIELSGNSVSGRKIENMNIRMSIDNYVKLFREIFNIMMAIRPERNDLYKKIYRILTKDIFPFLKGKNISSTNTKMVIDLVKNSDMQNIELNGVGLDKIAEKFYSKLN